MASEKHNFVTYVGAKIYYHAGIMDDPDEHARIHPAPPVAPSTDDGRDVTMDDDVMMLSSLDDCGDDVDENVAPHGGWRPETPGKKPVIIASRPSLGFSPSSGGRSQLFSPESSRPATAGSEMDVMELGSFDAGGAAFSPARRSGSGAPSSVEAASSLPFLAEEPPGTPDVLANIPTLQSRPATGLQGSRADVALNRRATEEAAAKERNAGCVVM